MNRKVYVAPSLLAANKDHLSDEIKLVESLGSEYIHWDIMDNIFVPNIALNSKQLHANYNIHKMVNDVHIMVINPLDYAKEFIENGADLVTFNIEATKDEEEVLSLIDFIHSKGVKVGVSIKPKTEPEAVIKYLDKIELVLVMSVEPGFGGQKFMPNALEKISFLRKYIDENHLNCLIEVDGGINDVTGQECIKAGVDILVAGSYLFGHEDIKERIAKLR